VTHLAISEANVRQICVAGIVFIRLLRNLGEDRLFLVGQRDSCHHSYKVIRDFPSRIAL
jgi:hypothetical protein